MEKQFEEFVYKFKDDDGTLYEYLYWSTNWRCFRKVRANGVDGKTKRVSESEYNSAWECYYSQNRWWWN